jgi:hypothetical protein
MNKLKNIGISALAGTLVSLSAAQAGGVSVTGSWELSYTNLNHEKVTGSKIGMKKNIAFGASGDVSDGGGVTWGTTIGVTDAMGLSSASMNINMGGIATLAYDSGTGGYGANAVDNIVPTAWEEIDYGLTTGITDVGAVSASKGVVNLTIKSPKSGTGVSFSYISRMGGGHIADGGTSGEINRGRGMDLVVDLVNVDHSQFGLRIGMAGEIEKIGLKCKNVKVAGSNASCGDKYFSGDPYGFTSYTTMKLGPLSLGVQGTFKDPMDPSIAGIANKRSIVTGAALTFGDSLSFSYGKAWDSYKYNDATRGFGGQTGANAGQRNTGGQEYEKINFDGFSAAINMGPVALKGTRNRVGGMGEGASSTGDGLDKTHTEINLSIAF